jgi:hypothetical protein
VALVAVLSLLYVLKLVWVLKKSGLPNYLSSPTADDRVSTVLIL